MHENIDRKRKREIASLSFFVLGLFLSIVFYFPQIRSGFLGAFFLRLFKGLIGPTAFVLPVFFFYIALSFFLDKSQKLKASTLCSALLSLVVFSAFLQNISFDLDTLKRASAGVERVALGKASATHFISLLWNESYAATQAHFLNSGLLGGVLGGTLGSSFATLFGQIGSMLILMSLFLCLVFFSFNWSFLEVFLQFKNKISPLRQKLASYKDTQDFLDTSFSQERSSSLSSVNPGQRGEAASNTFSYSSSNAGFSETEHPFDYLKDTQFDEVQSTQTLQTTESRLSQTEARDLEEAKQTYKESKQAFSFSGVQKTLSSIKPWWNALQTPEVAEELSEEGFDQSVTPNIQNKTPYAVPQSLKPSRMINPVPIGKVLSTDKTWETADPLEQELQVKRISPQAHLENPVSNLENLTYTEKSIWQPKSMQAGDTYGVAQGDLSNLHLASQSDSKIEVRNHTQTSEATFEPEILEAYYNAKSQEDYVHNFMDLNALENPSEIEKSDPNLDFKDDRIAGTFEAFENSLKILDQEKSQDKENTLGLESAIKEASLEEIQDIQEAEKVLTYDVERHSYGSSLKLEKDPKEASWVSLEEKNKGLVSSLKNEFNTGVQKTLQTVEQSLYNKGFLVEKSYQFPPLSLLSEEKANLKVDDVLLKEKADHLEETLNSFGVKAKVVHVTTGPSITRFEVAPGIGVKVSKIVGLADDIALALAAVSVRIEAPIPGKSAVGIEIPNTETLPVSLRGILESEKFKKSESALTVALGRDIAGEPLLCDLAKMPHLLIAGATGSGKSVCINSILMSLLYKARPEEVKLLLVDPKVVELKIYNDIPHLLAPVVTDPKKAANALNWAVSEMTRRYGLFAEKAVRDLKSYNEQIQDKKEKLPYILLIIDELADLMVTAANEVEDAISRLTAMARAAGIHLIIATQRPSVDVLTGVIKANIPSRIAFSVSSQIDSRTILDGSGAEKLLGKGDMLYAPQTSPKSQRAQGAYVSDKEVEAVTQFVKAQDYLEYNPEIAEAIVSAESRLKAEQNLEAESDGDMAFVPEAIELILETGQASTSILQRRLKLGYPRASRIIDYLESKGYVGPNIGSRPRRLLLTRERWEQIKKEEGR